MKRGFLSNRKRFFALLLCLTMLVGFNPIVNASGFSDLPDSIIDGEVIEGLYGNVLPTRNSSEKLSLQQLQLKFPHGKYWNHVGGSNNPDGWTNTPCTHHGSGCGYYPNDCTCNSFDNAIQCMGFAYKLAYDAYGTSARTWAERSNLDGLKPGDIIRYATHSIFVTAVNGDTITYGDANGINKSCIIRWNLTTTKSSVLNKGLRYVKIAPWSLDQNGSGSSRVTPSGLIDGGIYYIKNHWDNKYLDVFDFQAYNGAKLQVHWFNGSNAQKWRVTLNSNGTYKITSMVDERYTLDLINGQDFEENRIQLWENNTNANSQFRLYDNPNGTKRIEPAVSSTRSLSIHSGNDSSIRGIAVQISTTDPNSSNQQWSFEPAEGTYYIRNAQFGKYIDVPGASTYNGANLIIHPFNGTNAQKWILSRNSDGTYKFSSAVNSIYTIDVDSGHDIDGQKVQIWENNDNIYSKFNIIMYNGRWLIRPAFSASKIFDTDVGDGQTLQLWETNYSSLNQQWVFEPV